MDSLFVLVQTENAVEEMRQIECAATVQILLEEMEELKKLAEQAMDSGRADKTSLLRQFRIINILVVKAGFGAIRTDDTEVELDANGKMDVDATRKQLLLRDSEIALVIRYDDESFGLKCLLPDGSSSYPFIPVVSPMAEDLAAQQVDINYRGAEMLHEAMTEFTGSWNRYLKHVPLALSYCRSTGLRFLSHEETAKALGLSNEQLAGLNVERLSDGATATDGKINQSAAELRSLHGENGLPRVTDAHTFCLGPVYKIGQEGFFDPIQVAQFAVEHVDFLEALAEEFEVPTEELEAPAEERALPNAKIDKP